VRHHINEGRGIMGFYGPQPVTSVTAFYVWTGLGEPGHFFITAQGEAQNFTTGIQLVRESDFVGGLAVDVMGWTGPLSEGTTPYKVDGTFSGGYLPKVVVRGSNQTLLVDVQEIPADQVEQFLAGRAGKVSVPA
jgi:hypothetical protein